MTRHVQPPSRADTTIIPVARLARASAQPVRTEASSSRSLILLCIALIAAIVVATALLLSYTRESALVDNQRELANTALILAEQTTRSFQAIGLVQDSVVAQVRSLGIASPQEFNVKMATFDVHEMLRDKVSGLPFVDTIAVFTTGGILVNFTKAWPIPDLDISDRPHFKMVARGSGAYVSVPVRSRIDGIWSIYLGRPITAADGTVVGFVLNSVDLKTFEDFFVSIALSADSSISLFRQDGVLLVRYPRVDTAIGQDFSGQLNSRLLLQTPVASVRYVSTIDGQDRLFAAHSLDKFPVSAVVTTTVPAALAQWSVLAAFVATASALGSLAIAIMFRIILRGLRDRQALTQRRLDAQQLQLDAALNNMSQGLCMWDANSNLVMCNDRYIEMYGLSRDLVAPGVSLRTILEHRKVCGHLAVDLDGYVGALSDGLAQTATHAQISACGDGRTISIVRRALPDGGWVATHEDITERRTAELERDRNQEFLDCVIENVPVSIVVKSAADKRYILMNRAGERMLGISRDEALGRVAHEFFDKSTADAIVANDEDLLRSRTDVFHDEHAVKTAFGGDRHVTSRRMCIRNPAGDPQYLLIVVEDVTERRVARQQLQQAQRMEAVARLTGGLAHDFNNLLLIIIGNLDLLMEEVGGIPTAAEKVETILQASLRGADLTGRLLAFSRRQSLMPKRLQPNGLIRNLSTLLHRTLGANITIELKLCDELWPVAADESQLEAALINLAINARDAMPGGGKLIIATRNVVLDADCCAPLSDVKPGEFAAIEVTDMGTGMPPEVLARVFEPFFTTKTPDRGTGLGLSSVFGFVLQSGGHIDVQSEVGVGTRQVQNEGRAEALPKLAASLPAAASQTGARSSDQAILVVEDDPAIRAMVVAQLSALGYRIVAAEHAADALEKLETHQVDLLFTDMVMPGMMNGKQLAIAACAKYPGLRTLFTSGFPGESELAGAQLALDDVLLTKPYRGDALTAAVRKALDGQPA